MAADMFADMKVSVNKKTFQLIDGVLWHKSEIKRAKKTPGTKLGDEALAAKAPAAAGAGGAAAEADAADAGIGNINPLYNPQKSSLDLEARYQLCRSVAVECIQVRAADFERASRRAPARFASMRCTGGGTEESAVSQDTPCVLRWLRALWAHAHRPGHPEGQHCECTGAVVLGAQAVLAVPAPERKAARQAHTGPRTHDACCTLR